MIYKTFKNSIGLLLSNWVFSLFLHNLLFMIASAGAMTTEQPSVVRGQNDILLQLSSGSTSEPVVKVDLTNRGLTTFPNEVFFLVG